MCRAPHPTMWPHEIKPTRSRQLSTRLERRGDKPAFLARPAIRWCSIEGGCSKLSSYEKGATCEPACPPVEPSQLKSRPPNSHSRHYRRAHTGWWRGGAIFRSVSTSGHRPGRNSEFQSRTCPTSALSRGVCTISMVSTKLMLALALPKALYQKASLSFEQSAYPPVVKPG